MEMDLRAKKRRKKYSEEGQRKLKRGKGAHTHTRKERRKNTQEKKF